MVITRIEIRKFELETGATASLCFVEGAIGEEFSHEKMKKVARSIDSEWFIVRPLEAGFDRWFAC